MSSTSASLELDTYQVEASRTAIYPGQGADGGLIYAVLGAANEAGELAGALKKALRGDIDAAEAEARLVKEAGDVLWYLAAIATELNVSLAAIAEANLDKLGARAEAGALQGDGDNR